MLAKFHRKKSCCNKDDDEDDEDEDEEEKAEEKSSVKKFAQDTPAKHKDQTRMEKTQNHQRQDQTVKNPSKNSNKLALKQKCKASIEKLH